MQRWFWILVLALSGATWAQQNQAPASKSAPSSPPSSDSQDASGLSRDTTFPGDRPENNPPASTNKAGDAASKRAPGLAPPHSDRVQADELGGGVGESSSKD